MEQEHLSIVGANTKGDREENDFYPTPESTTRALLERERFEGEVFECACGDGSMSEVIKRYNPEVYSSDLINRGYGIQRDFLKVWEEFNNIITNPPYKLAKEFVIHAKKLAKKKIALLLKLVFLEGSGRYELFQDKCFPLKKDYVFCSRQPIYKNGIILNNSGLIAYAWFVWDKEYSGQPTIEWIKESKQKGGLNSSQP